MKKSTNDFLNSVKQKLTPASLVNNSPTWTQQVASSQGQPTNNYNPKQGMLSDSAVKLGLAELMAPGGTQQVADLAQNWWFGALQPIQPVAPASYRPRQRAFVPGENLIWTPGDDEHGGVPFPALRAMSDSWDLLRLMIETRKDQLGRLQWEIKVKKKSGETSVDQKQRQQEDPNVTKLQNFFKRPDGFHDWNTWLRMVFEDILVLDAGALYYQRDLQGRIASLMPLDGGTISRVLSDMGTTPLPPSVAYQQVVYGSPACDLTTDDLLYIMRNERTNRRYGFSPVSQIFITISIGLRRQDFQLQYYQSGNMPEALCFLPSNIPVTKIKEIQDWFDSVLAGNLAKRRRLTFLPGYGTGSGTDNVRPNVVFPKEVLLTDAMDDWLIRIVAFAFSVSPQNMMKQMNRASAEQASSVADEEGLEPGMTTIADFCNQVIEKMGMADNYEFAWQEVRDVDPEKQANIDKILTGPILTINETRENRGLDPRPEPEADQLGVFGPTGFVPLGQASQQFQQQQQGAQQQQDIQQNQEDRTQEMHDVNLQQAQQNLENPPPPSGPIGKVEKVDKSESLIPPGKFVHSVYGDLEKYDQFFAYDTETDTLLVKGDVDIDAARAELGLEGYLKK